MPTVSPFQIKKHPGVNEFDLWWWRTAETGGSGVANGDTVVMIEMPLTYVHVCIQALGTFPASTVLSVVGGVTNVAANAAPILNAGGTPLTINADKGMVFLTGGVPPFLGFTVAGGTGGNINVYMARRFHA